MLFGRGNSRFFRELSNRVTGNIYDLTHPRVWKCRRRTKEEADQLANREQLITELRALRVEDQDVYYFARWIDVTLPQIPRRVRREIIRRLRGKTVRIDIGELMRSYLEERDPESAMEKSGIQLRYSDMEAFIEDLPLLGIEEEDLCSFWEQAKALPDKTEEEEQEIVWEIARRLTGKTVSLNFGVVADALEYMEE